MKSLFKVKNNNNKKGKKKGKGGLGMGQQFFSNLLTVILVLVVIASLYSLLAENNKDTEEIPLSVLASDIISGGVANIVVEGDKLEIEYTDAILKKSKKEVEASLTETLVNYGVTNEQLAKVSIDIKNQTGFAFWLL